MIQGCFVTCLFTQLRNIAAQYRLSLFAAIYLIHVLPCLFLKYEFTTLDVILYMHTYYSVALTYVFGSALCRVVQ